MITRRGLLQMLPAAALARPSKPNILLVVLDDLGYGDFGCYGQKLIQTPNVDRVAREGTRFTDSYAGGAVCAPSRSCLMTGYHTGHTAIRANAGTIPLLASDVTVAQVLKKAGYATGGFGKWGLGDAKTDGIPTRHGFDEFFGYLHQVHAHNYYTDFLWDNEKKFAMPKGAYSADVIADRSLDFLKRHRNDPFFLYACCTLPHAKFEVPDLGPYKDKPWTEGQKTYAAMVTRADAYIGRLLKMLADYNLERDTVVLITSDNGAHSGEGKGFEFFQSNGVLRGEKGQLYEGGIRTPMIARWPGHTPAGKTNATPWAYWDMLPTLAEIAGAPAPSGIDGVSAAPLLRGERATALEKREFLYWEFDSYNIKQNRFVDERMSQAVRMGRWKAVREKPGAALELYDLATDIGEKNNVAAAHADVVRKIESYLATARTTPRPHDTGSMEWVK